MQRLLRTAKKLQNQFDKGLKGAAEKSRAVHGGVTSIMGEAGTFGGDRDWAAFVLGSGEKMAAQSSN